MSAAQILAINHRDLIQSASTSYRGHFQRLPHDLQDEIIAGLDASSLTLHAASGLVRLRGARLSHTAIAKYYRAVRHERRILLSGGLN
ncbi:MAG: hypothetical protein WB930_13865 [Syntrophobacteraceae bacterium]